jgi:hypothetical protein
MKKIVNITERDLYKFVFSPESLSLEVKTYLENNLDRFKTQIDYCKSLKNISENEIADTSIEILSDKILDENTIELIPSNYNSNVNTDKIRLAAASLKLEKKNYSLSFNDDANENAVKIISIDSQMPLYLFSTIVFKKATITLLPSEINYTVVDASKPIEILKEEQIDKVIISFSK